MTIAIARNTAGNCVEFRGSSLPVYYNFVLRAQLNTTNPARVDIINEARSNENGNTEFEFFGLDFNDYSRDDLTPFASAQEMVDYFNFKARVIGFTTDDGIDLSGFDLDFRVDETETTVLISFGEYFPVNANKAVADDDGTIHIYTLSSGTPINGIESEAERYRNIDHTRVSIDGSLVGGDINNVVNALNALFYQTGSPDGQPPVITSPSTIALAEGDALSYTLTADRAVEFEWTGLPSDIAVSTLNRRKLVGGSQLTAGTYNFSVKAFNYYGEASQSITLTVTSVMTPNTRSTEFQNRDYAESASGALGSIFGNSLSSPWSVHLWYKQSAASNNNQTIFAYGKWQVRVRGSDNRIEMYADEYRNRTNTNVITDQVWTHLLVVWNGSNFDLWVDGVSQTLTSGGDDKESSGSNERFYVGRSRRSGNDYNRGSRVDELAVFGSDQGTNVATLYNSGSTFDLSGLTTPPNHWYRMGDDDVFPVVTDNEGTADLTLRNMTVANFVTDAPS